MSTVLDRVSFKSLQIEINYTNVRLSVLPYNRQTIRVKFFFKVITYFNELRIVIIVIVSSVISSTILIFLKEFRKNNRK